MKINIIGDLHIANTVSTRTDNYFETCLNKLKQVLQADVVFCLGDFFNTPVVNTEIVSEVYTLLKEYSNTKVYTIVGNHDCYNMNESTLYKTSLGLLELVGAVTILQGDKTVTIDNTTFEAIPLNFKDFKVNKNNSIFLGHHFYGLTCSDSLNENILNEYYPNRTAVFLGHDHQPYETINNVYRPGSLLRNANTDYNRNRKPFYYQIDTDTKQITPIGITCKDGNGIFIDNLVIKRREKFIENLENTIARCSKKINTDKRYSMIEALSEVKTPKKCFDYIVATCKTMNVSIK